jgi:hypothetical protein
MASKKAFDLSRDSVYVADPITQLRIMGGKGVLPNDESGDLDTEADASMSVKDMKRLSRPLPLPFKKNIKRRGVNVPIIIVKIDDVAVVLEGKSRVRALRAANRDREAEGLQPYRIRCTIQRDTSPLALVATMVSSNNARMEDDFNDKLDKLAQMKDAGADDEQCADEFNVKVTTIKGWLAYTDNATPEVKQAVKDRRLGPSAAAELARVKDPDEQRKLLADLLTAPEPKARGVKAAKRARGAKGQKVSGKRELTALLEKVKKLSHPRAAVSTLSKWEGVEELLKFMTDDPETAAWIKEGLSA